MVGRGLRTTPPSVSQSRANPFTSLPPIGLVRATMITVIEPVFGILLAMLLFAERLSAVQWFGITVVVAGLLLLETPTDATNRFFGAFRSDPRA